MSPVRFASCPRMILPALLGLTPPTAWAAVFQWDGGSGAWSLSSNRWNGGQAWLNDGSAEAVFPAPAGTVTVDGDLRAARAEIQVPGYDLRLANTGGATDRLTLGGPVTGRPTFTFSGTAATYSANLTNVGLHFSGGVAAEIDAVLRPADLNSSPILGVEGAGTVVRFHGAWYGDQNNVKSSLVLRSGGKLAVTESAFLSFVLPDSWFTRQLWIDGDGTGIFETEEGFAADANPSGWQSGVGSYRLSAVTLVTHHSRNLPVGRRPDGQGGAQVNGHLVFENAPGSVWSVRTQSQSYAGAVWIGVDATFDTQADLTHQGITQFSSHSGSYWADNAFQTTAENVTITKTGAGTLRFAEETAFLPGAVLHVAAGAVEWARDPAAGRRKGGNGVTEGGPNLTLRVRQGGTARLLAPLSRLLAIDSHQGRVEFSGRVELAGGFSQNHQEDQPDGPVYTPDPLPGILVAEIGPGPWGVVATGTVSLGGELHLRRRDGFSPAPGTTFELFLATGGVSGQFGTMHDLSGLGCRLEYLADRVRLTTTRAAGTTGVVVDEDWTDGAFDDPGWSALANAAVGFFDASITREGAPRGLARKFPPSGTGSGFLWGIGFLYPPAFQVTAEDVLIIRMTTYADLAFPGAEYGKPEVACLHENSHIPYGHDNAAELSRHYWSTGSGSQLRPSVENFEIWVDKAHHPTNDTASTLTRPNTSLGVYRPLGADSNVEAFGENRGVDLLFAGKRLSHWDHLLISIPHSYKNTPTYATGVPAGSTAAHIGFSRIHVGVTHRTDANLDYATDALDFIHLLSFWGQSSTHLQSGDFDNDATTGASDLALWNAAAGSVHDPAFATSVAHFNYDALTDLPGTGSPPRLIYHRPGGVLRLEPAGSAVAAVSVAGPAPLALSDPAGPGRDWWRAVVRGRSQWADRSRLGAAGPVPLGLWPAGLESSAFGPALFGYVGGGGGAVAVEIEEEDPPTFASWQVAWLPGAATRTGPADDFDGDGWSNLVEFACGMNPAAGESFGPLEARRAADGSVVARLRHRPGAAGVQVVLQRSSDGLQSWLPVDLEPVIAADPGLPPGVVYREYPLPLLPQAGSFCRVLLQADF